MKMVEKELLNLCSSPNGLKQEIGFSTLNNPNLELILFIIPSYNPTNTALKNNIMRADM